MVLPAQPARIMVIMRIEDVPLTGLPIRLAQFLKLANLVESGSDAKAVVASGDVDVNGEVELRRGRQLVAGDVVSVGAASARVVQG